MKAYSMKKFGNDGFSISFRVNNEREWRHLFKELKNFLKSKFEKHINNLSFHRNDFGLYPSSQKYILKKKINNENIKIGIFKIKKGNVFSKNVKYQNKFYRKDFYQSFLIYIYTSKNKLKDEVNFSNPKVRNRMFDYFESKYQPYKKD